MTATTRLGSTFWRRVRRSPRFPYIVFLTLLASAVLSQVYQYWWGVQIQRMLDKAGHAQRVAMFPDSWKKTLGKGYLEPLEPITVIDLTPVQSQRDLAVDLRRLKWLPFLRRLTIYPEMAPGDWSALSELRQLKSLTVWQIPESGFVHVAKLHRLEEFAFVLNESIPPSAIDRLAGLSKLRKLGLHFSFGTARDLNTSPKKDRKLAFNKKIQALAGLHTVQRIDATSCSDPILLSISSLSPDGEPPLVNLTELRLDTSEISNAGLANLHNIPNLVHLDLSHSQVTDDGLETLKSIPNLRTLYLAGCSGVTDRGAERLAELTGLESLNVAATGMTPAGLLKLGPLTRLRALRLNSPNDLTPELRQRLPPTCKVITW